MIANSCWESSKEKSKHVHVKKRVRIFQKKNEGIDYTISMFKRFLFYLTIFSLFIDTHAQEGEKQESLKSGPFASGSVLYWRAQEGGLGYAIKSSSNSRLADAKIEVPDFDWDFGFQVNLGYRIPHDRWGVGLQFISLQTHTDAQKKAGGQEVFFPVWQNPSPANGLFATAVKMHWRLHLGLLDAELHKTYSATPTLSLTPQIAVRTGWIRQKFNLEYWGGNFAPGEEALWRMKNKYWGIGPKFGLDTQWNLAYGIQLWAQGAVSLLFGQFYLHQDKDALETKEKWLGIHDIFRGSAPIIEGSAGLRWRYLFQSLKQLQFELAWNQLLFFSQNQLLFFLVSGESGEFVSNQGDLSIAGVQFSMRMDF
jgi:hypothetical protein